MLRNTCVVKHIMWSSPSKALDSAQPARSLSAIGMLGEVSPDRVLVPPLAILFTAHPSRLLGAATLNADTPYLIQRPTVFPPLP